jgi:hypothetical protein
MKFLKTIATIIQFLMLMVLSNLTCQFSKKSEKVAYNFNEYVDMFSAWVHQVITHLKQQETMQDCTLNDVIQMLR